MGITVLVVEDNLSMQLNLELFLESHGFQPIIAKDGQEALDKLAKLEHLPQIILSDIEMPRMNGYEFYLTISKHPSWTKIPFIFLSAMVDPKDVRYGLELGVDEYITKPFDEIKLLTAIQTRIDSSIVELNLQSDISNKLKTLSQNSVDHTDLIKDSTEMKGFANLLDDPEKINMLSPHNLVGLFYSSWDERKGPIIDQEYIIPNVTKEELDSENIAINLFMVFENIYGPESFDKAQSLTLPLGGINKECFIYFHSIENERVRGNFSPFMICVLAEQFHYLATVRIKNILENQAKKIRNKEPWDIHTLINPIQEVLDLQKKIIKEVWIFNSDGTNLFSHAPNSTVDEDLLCNFISALQGFSMEISQKKLNALEIGADRYSIFHQIDYDFYVLGRANKYIPDNNIVEILSEISHFFSQKYASVLGKTIVNITIFKDFQESH